MNIIAYALHNLFFSVAPLTGRVADGLENVVSAVIIPGFLPQPLYKK